MQLSDSSQDANLLQGYLAPDPALLNHYTASWQTLLGKRLCIKIYFQIQFAYDLFKILYYHFMFTIGAMSILSNNLADFWNISVLDQYKSHGIYLCLRLPISQFTCKTVSQSSFYNIILNIFNFYFGYFIL